MAGVTLADRAATEAAGRRLAGVVRAGDLIILTGPLGAGKTTFTRGLGEGLGVRGSVTSPTFVIARVHPSLVGGPELLHVDAYRLDSADQMWDLDLDTESAVTVVEWGRDKAEGLSAQWLELTFARPEGGGTRLGAALQERDATGEESAGDDSAGDDSAGDDSAGDDSAGDESAGDDSAGDEADEPHEPRTVTWRSHGVRWDAVDVGAVLRGDLVTDDPGSGDDDD